jgi:hypothetical protein
VTRSCAVVLSKAKVPAGMGYGAERLGNKIPGTVAALFQGEGERHRLGNIKPLEVMGQSIRTCVLFIRATTRT